MLPPAPNTHILKHPHEPTKIGGLEPAVQPVSTFPSKYMVKTAHCIFLAFDLTSSSSFSESFSLDPRLVATQAPFVAFIHLTLHGYADIVYRQPKGGRMRSEQLKTNGLHFLSKAFPMTRQC
ncbi:hypothetical protein CISG_08352 [Coccidioides immitis RMSCC 3703]|uniref:Uncharacterized protein n=2 Tax=Coccidioides immitis TaxID=5501 RepID=A0A0J8R602_COCIT|nr:hypothetical protein CIRG_05693 [Coccidioides immitis RMSCC 2394]KMU80246.1 hypothetical protein CISG_08352 [Coccidioides immitis RMSCC 3703]